MSGKGSELKVGPDLQSEALKLDMTNVRQGGEREREGKKRGRTGTKRGPLAHAEYSDERNHGSPRSKARSNIFTGREVDFSVSSTSIDDVRSLDAHPARADQRGAVLEDYFVWRSPVYCAHSPGWLAGWLVVPACLEAEAC